MRCRAGERRSTRNGPLGGAAGAALALPLVAAQWLAGCGLGVPLDEYAAGTPQGSAGAGGAAGGGGGADASTEAGGAGGGSTVDASPDAPEAGASCTAPGTYTCAGAAQAAVLACQNGAWQHFLDCAGAKLCDSSLAPTVSDRCADQVAVCAGQSPGAYVCVGAALTRCGPDLVTATSVDCGTATLCALHAGGACGVCADGEFQCSGAVLKRCAPDHLSFTPVQTCATAAECNAGAGQCTAALCVPGQHQCSGAVLQACNAAQSGFDDVQTCASAALCDAPHASCDVCVGGTVACADGSHTQTCAADGAGWTTSACPVGAPDCVGAGQCVECASPADCPNGGTCTAATCTAGVCGTQVTAGAKCDDGNACTSGDTCSASAQCAGTSYTCSTPPDTQCQQATGVCNGDGTCSYIAKPNGAPCSGSNACHDYACSGGVCTDQGALGDGEICGPPLACKTCQAGVCTYACMGSFVCRCGGMCMLPGAPC